MSWREPDYLEPRAPLAGWVSWRVSVCFSGFRWLWGSRSPCPPVPGETAGEAAGVTQPVPTRVAPRQQGVNLLSVGKASRTLPACVCSEPGSSETETSRTTGPPAPLGSCPALPSMGRTGRTAWSGEPSGRGQPRGRPGPAPPPPEERPRPDPPPRPPAPKPGTSSGPWEARGQTGRMA